jgi:hypothetical protein
MRTIRPSLRGSNVAARGAAPGWRANRPKRWPDERIHHRASRDFFVVGDFVLVLWAFERRRASGSGQIGRKSRAGRPGRYRLVATVKPAPIADSIDDVCSGRERPPQASHQAPSEPGLLPRIRPDFSSSASKATVQETSRSTRRRCRRISFEPEGFVLNIRRSKTDREGAGASVAVPWEEKKRRVRSGPAPLARKRGDW